jgi:hypothetical protein
MGKNKSFELGKITIPGWLPGMADTLIEQAEDYFGDASGQSKKVWVKDTLKAAARAHDIKFIPDWIEHPMEDGIIDLIVESIYSLKFKTLTPEERVEKREVRKAKRAAKRARKLERSQ